MTLKKSPTRYGMLLFASALSLLFSCGRGCKPKEQEQIITVDVAFPLEALDSRYTTSATASRVAKLIYASLFEMNDNVEVTPFLAESFQIIDDKTFKIILRKNLKFHDGSPLTAHDVVYTFKELVSPDVASPHGEKFDYVSNMTAVNEHELLFELARPHAPFLTDLCAIGIVSKKACEGRSQQCRHENIGSGPYRVKAYDQAKEALTLAPFADWFEGAPKASLLLRVVRDENTRILELIGKKADIVDGEFSPVNAEELKKQSHLELKEVPGLGYTYLAFNVRGPRDDDPNNSEQYLSRTAIADKRVRLAIAHAIDFDQIIEKILLGTAKRVSGLIPNGHWAKDETLKPPAFDPTLAEKILDDAGFKRRGADNMRFKLTISSTPNRLRQNTAQLYADFLKRVGIDAGIRVKDWSALFQDMKQGQFELLSAIWVPVTDPDLYHFVHHSSSIPDDVKAGGNRHGYKNAEVDRLVELGRVTMEPIKRKAIYQEVERIMLTDLPYIPLWNEDRLVVLNRDRVKGFSPSPTGSLIGLRGAYVVDGKDMRASN